MVRMIDVKQKISKGTTLILAGFCDSLCEVIVRYSYAPRLVRLCSLTFCGTAVLNGNKVKLKFSFLCIVQYTLLNKLA